MKLIRNLSFGVLLMWVVNGCFTAPTYPIVPQIEILNDEMYYGKSSNGDSIVIALKFKDGDGDIGLSDDDKNDERYALQYYFEYQGKPVTFKTKTQNPQLNLPDFVTPYSCTNWEEIKDGAVVVDYLYTEFNPNYYNIFVDFLTKNPDGTFTEFDPTTYFKYPDCSIAGYDGRIPILSKDLGKKSPLDGKITYGIKGFAFDLLFSTETLKLKISIQDRASHKSNEVFTKEFRLDQIRK
jgi:hypothetical protein